MKSLNQTGAHHIMLPLLVVMLFAIGGTYMLVAGKAKSRNNTFIDISSPQCKRLKSIGRRDFGIVGLNGTELAFAKNKCLTKEVRLFDAYDVYVGTNYPSAHCSASLTPYKCGLKAAKYNLKLAKKYNLHPGAYWIDVEPGERVPWSTPENNVGFIRGMYDGLRKEASMVGYYSNKELWNQVTGGMKSKAPNWYAAGKKVELRDGQAVRDFCDRSFSGGPTIYVQYVKNDLDYNLVC